MAGENFIGSGIIFPIELSPQSGTPITRTGQDLIRSSIKMILGWDNQRFYLPEFISRLYNLLEEPNDELLAGLVEYFVAEQLSTWEPRIELISSRVDNIYPNKLYLTITYKITNTKIQDIFTFGFYREITT
jgi:hypothetical protein